ncbi:PEST proteolytic signal-containing nuclear protein-like [Pectinophora gossypiella]|uniref:PEST proteolytic signal-containing nuclear protein n=2 Tax=Pectinophora gossypiella TaxID=13191 RepID=A0A1E1WPH2_PECGO|nr:PEST proteolytic signal-containing nuclear protein-like [Pectinophora gossypiella]
MSSRYNDYSKGSSRSARDDSRSFKERGWDIKERRRSRSRSRSPRERYSPSSSSKSRISPEKSRSRERSYESKPSHRTSWNSNSDSEEEVPAPPPPPRISKISIGFTKPKAPIKMNIGASKGPTMPKPTVASVFSADDDDEPEEMPAEARMRMRNIGRETPTSAGPNSFGKTKQGFCDAKKVFEKNLKQALETPANKPVMPKFPQTIYKIKPSSL